MSEYEKERDPKPEAREWWTNWMSMSDSQSNARSDWPRAECDDIRCYVERNDHVRIVTELRAENARLREALESISKNSCCDKCQEAKLVALAALKDVPKNSTHEPKLGTPGVGFFDEQY